MLIVIYLLLAFLVVRLSIKLSQYVDILDKRTSISGAFIGGVLLAAVTSLPELFTSISATVLLDESELVIGNILGSNLFNITVLAILFLLFPLKFRRSRIAESHNTSVVFLAGIYLLLMIPIFTGWDLSIFGKVSLVSLLIFVLYLLSVSRMSADDGIENRDDGASSLTLRQVCLRFLLCSLALVGASVLVTYATDMLATRYHIGATLAGALLLGIATSLPEVTSSYSLAKMGNFNAMVGNMLGSNLFNFAILTLTDILYNGGSIYVYTKQTGLLLIFGLLGNLAIGCILLYKAHGRRALPRLRRIAYLAPNLVVIAGYLCFLGLSI